MGTAALAEAAAATGVDADVFAAGDTENRTTAHRVRAIGGVANIQASGRVGSSGVNEGAVAEVADEGGIRRIQRAAGEGHGAIAAGLPAHGYISRRVVPAALGEVAVAEVSDVLL